MTVNLTARGYLKFSIHSVKKIQKKNLPDHINSRILANQFGEFFIEKMDLANQKLTLSISSLQMIITEFHTKCSL